MKEYIGLDVSMKETAVSIRRGGERIWRGKCVSDPAVIAQLVRKRALAVDRIVFETGPLSVWFYHALRAEGLPAICIDARHAKSALDMAPNKTDANDADGLAHLAEIGFFREVRVKGFDSMLARTLIAARNRLVRITVDLSNHIRGFMKTFDLLVPAGKGSTFEAHVCHLLSDQPKLSAILLPMLEAFGDFHPWAGRDRTEVAAEMQISKGPNVVFAIGADIRRAIDYGLRLAEAPGLRQVPGAVMGYFVDGHPFLDGNGRTLMLVFGELCFRHGFSIAWERTRCMRCFETVRCLSEV